MAGRFYERVRQKEFTALIGYLNQQSDQGKPMKIPTNPVPGTVFLIAN